jgi:predicted dehydrogenase
VVVAYAGEGSSDFELSTSRVKGFTEELRDKQGVKILATPEAVAQAADLVLLESVDGRVHLEQFKRILPFKRPTFIDKPLATKLDDAQEIIRLAAEAGVAMMSCSSLRYADNFVAALAEASAGGGVNGLDVFGPLSFQPTQPGWFWYGIHSVEMIVAALGPGCGAVRVKADEKTELLIAAWPSGRIATIRGLRTECKSYGATVHWDKGVRFVDVGANERPIYAGLVEQIMTSLPRGKSPVPPEQMLEVMRILEAANRSRQDAKEVVL